MDGSSPQFVACVGSRPWRCKPLSYDVVQRHSVQPQPCDDRGHWIDDVETVTSASGRRRGRLDDVRSASCPARHPSSSTGLIGVERLAPPVRRTSAPNPDGTFEMYEEFDGALGAVDFDYHVQRHDGHGGGAGLSGRLDYDAVEQVGRQGNWSRRGGRCVRGRVHVAPVQVHGRRVVHRRLRWTTSWWPIPSS